jgi:hypothetical protein
LSPQKGWFCPSCKKAIFEALNFKKGMVLRAVVLLVCLISGFTGFAQETEAKKTTRPDIPGNFLVELGLNLKNGVVPPNFQKGFWGSRTINFYYQYPIRIRKSNFSFVPGIGLSLERWKFTNNYTLPNRPEADGSFPLVLASTIYPGTIKRSQLVNNYLEMPVEFRYDSKPEDMARSLSVVVGGRVGVLYDSFTKVDYTVDGDNKSMKDKQWHGLNQIRYGLYGRFGISGFSVFMYYNLSPMFQTNKGPDYSDMNSVTMGISINGF